MNGDGLSRLFACKKIVVIARPDFLKIISKGLVNEFIDHEGGCKPESQKIPSWRLT